MFLPSPHLGDTSSIQSLLNQAASQYNIPPQLLYSVAYQESRLNPTAKSSAGAIGVMQLMPTTAASLGVTDPYDPQQNINGGAKYLAQLYQQFGDWSLALAAYNAGPGNVTKYGGIPPFSETQNYVANVMNGAGDLSATSTLVDGGTVDGSVPISGSSPSDFTIPALVAIGAVGLAWALS